MVVTLQVSLNEIVKKIISELDTLEILKAGLSRLLVETVEEALKDIPVHGRLVVYFNKEEIPFYIEGDESPELFCFGYKKSDEERSRTQVEMGGGPEEIGLAYGNFITKRLLFGSLLNHDKQTKDYISRRVLPAVRTFFETFGFKVGNDPEFGVVHDTVGV